MISQEALDKLTKLPPSAQKEVIVQALREEFKASLFKTCYFLLGYKDVNMRTHGKMIRALEAQTKRKLIVMPRGSLKSSIGVVGFCIFILINLPNATILIDSEVYENSKNFLREIKAHLETPLMTTIFGDFVGSIWTEGEIVINQRKKPRKEASVTCGGITTIKVGQHYDFIIADDLNSTNNSETDLGRKKVITHWRMNLAILNPGGTAVLIGTRYAANDCIGHVIENEIGYGTACRLAGTKI